MGDLVKMTAGVNSFQGQVGTVGKLKNIETGVSPAASRTGVRYTVEGSFWYAGDVEKVVEAETAPEPETEPEPVKDPRPEVRRGDTVRIVKINVPYAVSEMEGGDKIGEVREVYRNLDNSIRYIVVLGWGVKEYEIVTPEEAAPAPEPEADPVTDPLKITDRDGDRLELTYLGYNNVVKVHTNRGGHRDFSSVYLTASDLDDVIARLQEFKKAYEASGDRFPF